MDAIIKIVSGVDKHYLVIPNIYDITVSGGDSPQTIISLPDKTIVVPASELPAMAEVNKLSREKYVRDCESYEKAKEENIRSINDVVLSYLEPHLDKEKFIPQKSLLPYRGAKMEVIRKFSSFIFNCLNYFWADFGEEAGKQIESLSIPTVSDSDRTVEHIFVSLMKGLRGFDVFSLFRKDFIQPMLIKSYESCAPVTKPIQGSYKPDREKSLQASIQFAEGLIGQIQAYYAEKK